LQGKAGRAEWPAPHTGRRAMKGLLIIVLVVVVVFFLARMLMRRR
jgi:hypothetical protein